VVENYRNLLVWQRAVQLAVSLYRFTQGLPAEEMNGLSAQLRRAGVAVASNIADGCSRHSPAEHKHFFTIARGANIEVQTQLVIARELGYGDQATLDEAERLSVEVNRLLAALLKSP
jgi:four helix bundle protein